MEQILDLIQWTISSPIESFIVLIITYIALFGLYRQKRFKRVALFFKYPFGFFDGLINITAFSILMLELPRGKGEWTVTGRLKRYKRDHAGESWDWNTPITWYHLYHYYTAVPLCWLANKVDSGHCEQ